MRNSITCKEIAAIAGMTTTRIRQLGILPDAIGKGMKKTLLYSRQETLDNWHKKRAERLGEQTKITVECLQDAQINPFIAFMKGDYDPSHRQERHKFKKLASKMTKPITVTVRLISDFD